MTPTVTPEILRDIGLFGGLDDESLTILARELPAQTVEGGKTVVEEGDRSAEMFVIVGGELEVFRANESGEQRIALLGPGDWFGEMSILDVQPRSASVRALAPTLLVRITAEHVDTLLYRRDLKAYSLLIMNMARELSRRLRVADGILTELMSAAASVYQRKR